MARGDRAVDDQAGRARDVPEHVELLLAFVNSLDEDEGTDELTTAAELGRWVHAHGLAQRVPRAGAADLALALRLRAALHAAFVGHHDGRTGGDLDAAAAELPLRLVLGPDGPRLVPVATGVRGALSHVLVAVASATADGTWGRLKICASSECRWAYFDSSKNRSRAWCEWGCGNRIKTRRYRARRAGAVEPAD